MKCSECGADIFEGISRCPFCKTPTSTVTDERFKNFDFTYTISSKEQIKAIRDSVAEVSEKKSGFSLQKNPMVKKSHKRRGKTRQLRSGKIDAKKVRGFSILGVALLFIVAIIWGIIALIGSIIGNNTTVSSYTYIKGNSMHLIYKGDSVELTNHTLSKDYVRRAGEDSSLVAPKDILQATKLSYNSKNGTVTYYFEDYDPETNSGTLKMIKKGKEKSIKTVADDVHNSIIISQKGESILFLQSSDKNGDMGVLYYWKNNMKEPHKISSDIDHNTFAFSSDGDEAIYIQNLDRTLMQGDLYSKNLKKLKKEKVKIDNDVCYVFGTDNKGNTYIYAKGFDPTDQSYEIYARSNKADSEKIRLGERTKLPPHMLKSKNYMFVYGINEDGTHNLYYVSIKNGDKEKVASGVERIVKISKDEKHVMYSKVYNEATADYYIYTSGKQPQKVAENVNVNFTDIGRSPQLATSEDLRTIAYINGFDPRTGSGKLFLTNFKPGKETTPKPVSDDVHSCFVTAKGKIIYTKDYSVNRKVFDVYAYNKKSSDIIKDELTSDMFEVSEKGNAILYVTGFNTEKNVGELKTSDLKGDSDMISEDVFGFSQTESGDIFFYKNFDVETSQFDLYYVPEGKTDSNLIDTKIDSIQPY